MQLAYPMWTCADACTLALRQPEAQAINVLRVLSSCLQKYCGNPGPGLVTSAFPVSLGQCANIAYGVCQAHAMSAHKSPCGHHFKGYQQCSGQQFMSFYTNIVNDGCKNAIQWIEQAAKITGRRLKL